MCGARCSLFAVCCSFVLTDVRCSLCGVLLVVRGAFFAVVGCGVLSVEVSDVCR